MRIEPTAAALHLHPNSLRKSLRRFEDVASCDLRAMRGLIGIWWALRRREAREAARPPGPDS